MQNHGENVNDLLQDLFEIAEIPGVRQIFDNWTGNGAFHGKIASLRFETVEVPFYSSIYAQGEGQVHVLGQANVRKASTGGLETPFYSPANSLADPCIMTLTQARKLALRLMRLHKLSPEWSFGFDRSKVRFGKCNHANKEISLSRYLVELNGEKEVRETILHEIAHAPAPRAPGTELRGGRWRARSAARQSAATATRSSGPRRGTKARAQPANE